MSAASDGDADTTDKKLLGRKTIARFREKFLFVILRIDGGPDGWMDERGKELFGDGERGRRRGETRGLIPK